MHLIEQLSSALQKLSYLNRSLLLLSKIENKQFSQLESVSVQEVVDNALSLYESALTSKEITVNKSYLANPVTSINRGVFEILMNNLIQNAVRHNVQGGAIDIEVSHEHIVIENTGPAIESPESIFERFTRSDQSIGSIGLGLAIVKEIVNASGMSIDYRFQQSKNCFTLHFNDYQ